MNFNTGKFQHGRFMYFLLFVISGVILFIPVINKYFVSDDFLVLKRVCLTKTLWIQGFFRPLSDVTLYANYTLGGFDPFGYNLVNILIHSFNSYLLFVYCLQFRWTHDKPLALSYAFMAGFLFLAYPFHNEAIAWTLGRGASLAGTFAIAGLLITTSVWSLKARILGTCVCYFIGLTAYESIIILPAIILIQLMLQKTSRRNVLMWMTSLVITCFMHLIVRFKLSGAIVGAYGYDLLKTPWINYPGNIVKVLFRLIIPPLKESNLFMLTSTIIVVILALVVLMSFRKLRARKVNKIYILGLLSMLGLSLVVPFLFAVSTRTSESDRLLYLPSFFMCCIISFIVNNWIRTALNRRIVFVCICIYYIVFLELNNYNWHRAGLATKSIINLLKADHGSGKIHIANLPDEINGAYIFRMGFKEALLINSIDTTKVVVINRLSKEATVKLQGTLIPEYTPSAVFIPPSLKIQTDRRLATFDTKSPGIIHYNFSLPGKLYYWNLHTFVLVDKLPEYFDKLP